MFSSESSPGVTAQLFVDLDTILLPELGQQHDSLRKHAIPMSLLGAVQALGCDRGTNLRTGLLRSLHHRKGCLGIGANAATEHCRPAGIFSAIEIAMPIMPAGK